MTTTSSGDLIDLRSDTVTRPDEEMRRAMASAEVGDDVLGEDPTVRALEEEAAAAVGLEAALFVPSGTMGNQIALHLHARPGQEVVCDARSHVVKFEVGAMAALSGLQAHPLDSPHGLLQPAAVESAIAPNDDHRPRTAMLVIENSHNMAGGTLYDRPHLDALQAVAGRHGLPVHLDGARIFNAAAALGTSPAVLAAGFSSVMFCLSKGLGAPVGSLVCGSRDLVQEARRVRKMFGGGMRQVGILAAAGLVALRKGPARLPDDHANAALLAAALGDLRGVEIDPATVRTNIVIFRLTPAAFGSTLPAPAPAPAPGSALASASGAGIGDSTPNAPYAAAPDLAAAFVARLRDAGILASAVSPDQVRMVTHRDVPRPLVEQAIARLRRAFAPAVAMA